MVKIFGKSDGEKKFVLLLKKSFKLIKIKNVKDFQNINLNKIKKSKEEIIDKKITKLKNKLGSFNLEDIYSVLSDLNKQINIKFELLKKIRNKSLKNEVYKDIKELKNNKKREEKKLKEIKKKTSKDRINLKKLFNKKKEINYFFKKDLEEISKIKKDRLILSTLSSAISENQVIDYIKNNFKNQKLFYLINSLDINLEHKKIYLENLTLYSNQIDHILICPKGIFLIETKSWKSPPKNYGSKLEFQIKKIRKFFSEIILEKYKKNIKFFLIYTKEEVKLKKYLKVKSIPLNNFFKEISKEKNVFKKSEIFEILYLLSFHMDEGHINYFQKFIIKIRKILKIF